MSFRRLSRSNFSHLQVTLKTPWLTHPVASGEPGFTVPSDVVFGAVGFGGGSSGAGKPVGGQGGIVRVMVGAYMPCLGSNHGHERAGAAQGRFLNHDYRVCCDHRDTLV